MEDNNLQVAEQLIQRAKEGNHTTFEFLCSIEEYFAAREIRAGLRKVVESFTDSRDKLFKAYLRTVERDSGNLDVVLALAELKTVINYYEKELEITEDIIDEYRVYVHSGHIIDTLIGNYRREEDLYDHRSWRWINGD